MEPLNSLQNAIRSFSGLKTLIIGDVMTDAYVFGKVDRISPEAPVPVVHISGRENRPGGAANVAINIKALGATPLLCSITGDDDAGYQFATLLEQMDISSSGLMHIAGRRSTVKTRVIGNSHQLIRVDDETTEPVAENDAVEFTGRCLKMIRSEKPDVIIFEDYDKGLITKTLIDTVTREAESLGIPVTVDPKIRNFNHYNNVTLFKPNLHELKSGLGVNVNSSSIQSIKAAVTQLMKDRKMEMIMVTLSEHGIFICNREEAHIIPAHIRNISDVSGAGDTVISVASLALASGLSPVEIAGLANLAGGLVCEEVGVVPVNLDRLLKEAGQAKLVPDPVKS